MGNEVSNSSQLNTLRLHQQVLQQISARRRKAEAANGKDTGDSNLQQQQQHVTDDTSSGQSSTTGTASVSTPGTASRGRCDSTSTKTEQQSERTTEDGSPVESTTHRRHQPPPPPPPRPQEPQKKRPSKQFETVQEEQPHSALTQYSAYSKTIKNAVKARSSSMHISTSAVDFIEANGFFDRSESCSSASSSKDGSHRDDEEEAEEMESQTMDRQLPVINSSNQPEPPSRSPKKNRAASTSGFAGAMSRLRVLPKNITIATTSPTSTAVSAPPFSGGGTATEVSQQRLPHATTADSTPRSPTHRESATRRTRRRTRPSTVSMQVPSEPTDSKSNRDGSGGGQNVLEDQVKSREMDGRGSFYRMTDAYSLLHMSVVTPNMDAFAEPESGTNSYVKRLYDGHNGSFHSNLDQSTLRRQMSITDRESAAAGHWNGGPMEGGGCPSLLRFSIGSSRLLRNPAAGSSGSFAGITGSELPKLYRENLYHGPVNENSISGLGEGNHHFGHPGSCSGRGSINSAFFSSQFNGCGDMGNVQHNQSHGHLAQEGLYSSFYAADACPPPQLFTNNPTTQGATATDTDASQQQRQHGAQQSPAPAGVTLPATGGAHQGGLSMNLPNALLPGPPQSDPSELNQQKSEPFMSHMAGGAMLGLSFLKESPTPNTAEGQASYRPTPNCGSAASSSSSPVAAHRPGGIATMTPLAHPRSHNGATEFRTTHSDGNEKGKTVAAQRASTAGRSRGDAISRAIFSSKEVVNYKRKGVGRDAGRVSMGSGSTQQRSKQSNENNSNSSSTHATRRTKRHHLSRNGSKGSMHMSASEEELPSLSREGSYNNTLHSRLNSTSIFNLLSFSSSSFLFGRPRGKAVDDAIARKMSTRKNSGGAHGSSVAERASASTTPSKREKHHRYNEGKASAGAEGETAAEKHHHRHHHQHQPRRSSSLEGNGSLRLHRSQRSAPVVAVQDAPGAENASGNTATATAGERDGGGSAKKAAAALLPPHTATELSGSHVGGSSTRGSLLTVSFADSGSSSFSGAPSSRNSSSSNTTTGGSTANGGGGHRLVSRESVKALKKKAARARDASNSSSSFDSELRVSGSGGGGGGAAPATTTEGGTAGRLHPPQSGGGHLSEGGFRRQRLTSGSAAQMSGGNEMNLPTFAPHSPHDNQSGGGANDNYLQMDPRVDAADATQGTLPPMDNQMIMACVALSSDAAHLLNHHHHHPSLAATSTNTMPTSRPKALCVSRRGGEGGLSGVKHQQGSPTGDQAERSTPGRENSSQIKDGRENSISPNGTSCSRQREKMILTELYLAGRTNVNDYKSSRTSSISSATDQAETAPPSSGSSVVGGSSFRDPSAQRRRRPATQSFTPWTVDVKLFQQLSSQQHSDVS